MWGDWLGNLWDAARASDIKWTDVAIVVFTFGQVWIGIRQARIADKTRNIAESALGRPYVFVVDVTHNLADWPVSADFFLSFKFKLANHGSAPAIISIVNGNAILSFGPEAPSVVHGGFISAFPPKSGYIPKVKSGFSERTFTIRKGQTGGEFILRPNEISEEFTTTRLFVALPELHPVSMDSDLSDRRPAW